MKVLVVDDEPQIVRALRAALHAHGHEVSVASNGQEALVEAAAAAPDLIVLDLGLPDRDGTDVIRELRGWSDVPVIVLSVRDAQAQKVAALDAGADDYVTKPFGLEELLARMRAAKRRAGPQDPAPAVLRFGELVIDAGRQLVLLRGSPVHLTRTEYRLLEAMATNPGKLLTHRWLLQRVWGPQYGVESNYLRVYVRQLRRKLGDDAASPTFITTEPGVGYRWMMESQG
ncbi:MAG: response regulator transcription factor [Actinomycetota bacterium]|nr:response regulator transcription factor [Actinomycetota bacterium]